MDSFVVTDRLYSVSSDVYVYSISEDELDAIFARDLLYMLYINVLMREDKGNHYVRTSCY